MHCNVCKSVLTRLKFFSELWPAQFSARRIPSATEEIISRLRKLLTTQMSASRLSSRSCLEVDQVQAAKEMIAVPSLNLLIKSASFDFCFWLECQNSKKLLGVLLLYSSVFPKCWVNDFHPAAWLYPRLVHIFLILVENQLGQVSEKAHWCAPSSPHLLTPYLFLDLLISNIENCQVQLKCRWKKRPGSNLFLPMSLCLCHESLQVKRVVPVIQGIREAVFYDV